MNRPSGTPANLGNPEALARSGHLRLIARRIVESFVTGQHRSLFKGFNVEFAQHREYAPGDELRHLDWKVFARRDRLFVKQYEEETNLRVTLALDASASMRYASAGESKLDYARKAAAALAYLLIGQSDAVGLAVFDTRIQTHVPARTTSSHLNTLFDVLAQVEAGGETQLGEILRQLAGQSKRRSLIVLLSDLFAGLEELAQSLALFRHRRHEVILLQILDPHEISFPFKTLADFRSLERPGQKVRVDSARLRKAYLERFDAFTQALRKLCHRHRFDHLMLATDQPHEQALAAFLAHRRER